MAKRRLLVVVVAALSACSVSHPPKATRGSVVYRIQSGETLRDIGAKYGVSDQAIVAANDIDDPSKLKPGQLIRIPAVVKTAAQPLPELSFAPTTTAPDSNSPDRPPLRRISLGSARGYVGRLVLPVSGARVTSNFGWRSSKFHEGVDLACEEHTKIRAAHDGEVVYEDDSYGGYGRVIVIKGDGFLTVYAHNRRNRVSVGDTVRQGEWIGDVGHTGDASGSHLHFETRIRDESGRYAAVNPFHFMKDRPVTH